jgi:Amino acid transporters
LCARLWKQARYMQMAGILGFPMALLAAGIAFGGDFSTLNSSIAVPPRYLYAMAREGAMPKFFAKLHPKYKTPYVSILVLGVLSLILTKYTINFVASVSLFADLFYYVIGIAAAYGLRKKHPDLKRPYSAPLIKIGAPVSLIIYLVMMTQLDRYAIVSGIIWCFVGLGIYFICRAKYGEPDNVKLDEMVMEEVAPSDTEKKAMDKEYKLWKTIVAVFCILAVVLYIIPYIAA